ncbi:MAG: cadmium-translocating P-type ATPase [Actinobacteria bacterium]|nr:cadmium-translocating P-type ATPase [Actinomycetota bacterium]
MIYMVVDSSKVKRIVEETFPLSGLDCPDCALKVEKAIKKIPGVKDAAVNFAASNLNLKYDPSLSLHDTVFSRIRDFGYEVGPPESIGQVTPEKKPFWLSGKHARIVLASAVPLALGGILQLTSGLNLASISLYIVTILLAGYRPVRSSISSIRSFTFDMNVLMTFAVIGAAILGQWAEGATVMFLYSFGIMLEAYTMDKTRHAIHGLIEITPNHATVKIDGGTKITPVEDLHIGDIVIVKPGERIPVDGRVVYGRSSVNQAAITGESLPITKDIGDAVYAGTLNHEGYIEVSISKLYKDTTIAHIIHLVEDAQAKKAPSQQFIGRFSAYYTPIVISIAFAIAIIPPILGESFTTWFYRALVLLVISCPCALIISTPVSIASAIGAASKNGVLIKGGSHLEVAGQVSSIVFDKTGTLTSGQLEVTDIVPLNGYSEDEIIKITSALESKSEHPVADAIVDYGKSKGLEFPETDSFQSLPGRGLKGKIGGIVYYAGSPRLFSEIELVDPEVDPLIYAMQRDGKTVFMLGTENEFLGLVAVADSLRRGAKSTIKQLRRLGISNIIMLTGDNKDTAEEISKQIGIDDYRAELLPEDKVVEIENISRQYGRVAMIGDGINDAPAISRADVGIAMGAVGSDTALETADIALMGGELGNIPYTINLSRRTLRIIKQNVAASIVVKIAFVGLAVLGIATLWMAVFADTGISILVILNGMRLFSSSPPLREGSI